MTPLLYKIVGSVLIVGGLFAYARVEHSSAVAARAELKVAKAATAQAVASANRSEEGRLAIKAALEQTDAELQAAEAAGKLATQHAHEIAAAAARHEAETLAAAKKKEAELTARLAGLTECQQCETVLDWLNEQIGAQ